MTANGFLEQKQASPLSLGMVVALHGAAIAAVLMVKGQEWIRHADPPLKVYPIETIPPPPLIEPPQQERLVAREPISRIDVPDPILRPAVPDLVRVPDLPALPPPGPVAGNDRIASSGGGSQQLVTVPLRPPIRTPVRVDAQFDPRFASALQPPYPLNEQRNEREGEVRIRVTIGTDGRVIAAERVSAASDAFWRATREQALSRWRFRPATEDGRPVQATKVLTVRFRLDG